jgi:hypothetical protein
MQKEDKERQLLINRLKTVRDPRERDRIIRLLARMEKSSPGKIEESPEDQWTAPAETRGSAETKEEKIPKGVGFMLGYALPAFFVIFGLFYISNALMRLISGEGDPSAGPQLFMGVMFLIFGIFGFLKMRRTKLKAALPRQEAGKPLKMWTRK